MDYTRIKAEIIKKHLESKAFLSKIDFWSYITQPSYFTFKSSQNTFKSIKADPEVTILEEKVSSGKLAIIIQIPEIKLDEHILNKIEIIQDIEFGNESIQYLSSHYLTSSNFNTKNPFNNKPVAIFDIKSQENTLVFKLFTDSRDFIEISHTY